MDQANSFSFYINWFSTLLWGRSLQPRVMWDVAHDLLGREAFLESVWQGRAQAFRLCLSLTDLGKWEMASLWPGIEALISQPARHTARHTGYWKRQQLFQIFRNKISMTLIKCVPPHTLFFQ